MLRTREKDHGGQLPEVLRFFGQFVGCSKQEWPMNPQDGHAKVVPQTAMSARPSFWTNSFERSFRTVAQIEA